MTVIDSSTLAKYILKEPNWMEVEEYLLREEISTLNHTIKEVANAIWKITVIYKAISKEVAEEKFKLLKTLTKEVITIKPQEKILRRSIQNSIKTPNNHIRRTIHSTSKKRKNKAINKRPKTSSNSQKTRIKCNIYSITRT